jgi:hypothetical protein
MDPVWTFNQEGQAFEFVNQPSEESVASRVCSTSPPAVTAFQRRQSIRRAVHVSAPVAAPATAASEKIPAPSAVESVMSNPTKKRPMKKQRQEEADAAIARFSSPAKKRSRFTHNLPSLSPDTVASAAVSSGGGGAPMPLPCQPQRSFVFEPAALQVIAFRHPLEHCLPFHPQVRAHLDKYGTAVIKPVGADQLTLWQSINPDTLNPKTYSRAYQQSLSCVALREPTEVKPKLSTAKWRAAPLSSLSLHVHAQSVSVQCMCTSGTGLCQTNFIRTAMDSGA